MDIRKYVNRPVLAIAVITALCVSTLQAQARAPMHKTPAPGYYHFMLGNFEVTALSDGTKALPVAKLLNQAPEKTNTELQQRFLSSPLETSFNAYLINTGKRLVLIDSGAGKFFGPTLGKLSHTLKAAGYTPAQVDDIFITHMHPDHVGGLSANGKVQFPNATLHINKKDTDYWLSPKNLAQAPQSAKGFFQGAMSSVNPYVKTGQLKPFSGNSELVPGISSETSFGHTPGHTSYKVQSNGQTLLVVGDLIHVGAVQFAHPQVTISFDSDPKKAEQSRIKVFDQAANNRTLIAGAHLPFPGVGHIRKHGDAYVWLPINYMQIH